MAFDEWKRLGPIKTPHKFGDVIMFWSNQSTGISGWFCLQSQENWSP